MTVQHGSRLSRQWLALAVGTVGTLLLVVCMLPERRSHEPRFGVCRANLGGLGKSLAIYANMYRGQFAPDLETLVRLDITQSGSLLCPAASWTRLQAGHGDEGVCDYIYIAGQSESDDPNNVVAYDRKGNHPDGSTWALFLNGDTKSVASYAEVERLVAQTRQRLAGKVARSQPATPRTSAR